MTSTRYISAKARDGFERDFPTIVELVRGGMTLAAAFESGQFSISYRTFRNLVSLHPDRREMLEAARADRQGSENQVSLLKKYDESNYAEVLAIIADNPFLSVRRIFATLIGEHLPGLATVKDRRRHNAVFAARYAAIMAARPKREPKPKPERKPREKKPSKPKKGRILRAKKIPPVVLPDGQLKRALRLNELYMRADRATSRRLDPHVRDDVRSDLVLAMLEDAIDPGDLGKAAKGFEVQRQHWHKRLKVLSSDRYVTGADGEHLAYIDSFTTNEVVAW